MFWTVVIGLVALAVLYKFLSKPTPKNLNGQVVLITGAGSGIGRLMAKEFAKNGCRLVLWDINAGGLQETAKEITALGGAKAECFAVDVSAKDEIYKTAAQVKQIVGNVDIIVNNAGIVAGKYFWELRDDQIERVINVNTLGVMFVTKAFLPDMIARNSGHVVTIASAGGTSAAPKLADYCASKFAVVGFTEALRLELEKTKKTGVHTTLVCPFYIATGMFEGVKSGSVLFPILEPQYVASEVVRAVKENQEELFLPGLVSITYFARFFFPVRVRDWVIRYFGVSKSMDEFAGQRRI